MKANNNISHKANAAINNFYQAFGGDFEKLSLKDCHFLEEELTTALNSLSNILDKKTTKEKPKRGDEIQQFFFISKTKSGCPKLEQRIVGHKGITHIEITNVGKSFFEDSHLTKVRVSGLKEDGKTEYQMFFNDVYTSCSSALFDKFSREIEKHKQRLKCAINNAKTIFDKHNKLMADDLDKIYKKMFRKTK